MFGLLEGLMEDWRKSDESPSLNKIYFLTSLLNYKLLIYLLAYLHEVTSQHVFSSMRTGVMQMITQQERHRYLHRQRSRRFAKAVATKIADVDPYSYVGAIA